MVFHSNNSNIGEDVCLQVMSTSIRHNSWQGAQCDRRTVGGQGVRFQLRVHFQRQIHSVNETWRENSHHSFRVFSEVAHSILVDFLHYPKFYRHCLNSDKICLVFQGKFLFCLLSRISCLTAVPTYHESNFKTLPHYLVCEHCCPSSLTHQMCTAGFTPGFHWMRLHSRVAPLCLWSSATTVFKKPVDFRPGSAQIDGSFMRIWCQHRAFFFRLV